VPPSWIEEEAGMRARAVGSIAVLVGLIGVAVAGGRPAHAFHEKTLHIDGRAWFPEVGAEVRSSRGAVRGDLITEQDLDVDDPDYVPSGAVTLRLGRHTLRADGFDFDVEGDTRIDRSFTFDGRTYPVSTRVRSDAEATVLGLEYGFDVVHTEVLALGLSLGARYVTGEASLRAVDLGLSGRGEFDTVMPAIGLALVVHPVPVPILSSLALSARASGGTIGDDGRFIDLDAGIEWLPIPVLSIRAGYRYFEGRGEDGGDEAKFELSGPYVGLTLAF
jgi:hypothetical protein